MNPLAPKKPPLPAKAKNVIFMFMEGGPSQLDLFDPKPGLAKWNGKPLPADMTKNLKLAFIKPTAAVLASPRVFTPAGQSGIEFSDYIPHMASCADDMCLVRSMFSDAFNHHPGQLLLFSGTMQFGRPTMGAWVLYGLGSESQNLPGFVVLSSGVGTSAGANNWASGFLPSTYQGVTFRSSGDPVLYLSNPKGVTRERQRASLDALRDLNEEHYTDTGDVEIASRIASYELAFRMQMSAPELLDFSKESPETREMYGVDDEPTKPFATNCLLARRLVERGVRFVMIKHASWDDHSQLNKKLKKNCDIADQPTAALIKDLKQRGLLDSTLVVWGGEFGRTPLVEIRNPNEVGQRRPRSSSAGVQPVAGRRRHQGRHGGGQDRRAVHEHRGRQGAHPRSAGDHAALSGLRSHAADVPPHGPRFPADGCGGQRSQEDAAYRPHVPSRDRREWTDAARYRARP